jgi:hypothetical protein
MYAMAIGNSTVAIQLLEAGANAFLGDDFHQSAFMYAQSQGNWNTIMDIIGHIHNYAQETEKAVQLVQFWVTLGVVLSLQGDVFGRKLGDLKTFLDWGADPNRTLLGGTLAHLAKDGAEIQALVSHGFSKFDHKDKTGAHALISAAKLRNPRMIESFLRVQVMSIRQISMDTPHYISPSRMVEI